MKDTKLIALTDINTRGGTQMREEMSGEVIEQYANDKAMGCAFPPPIVFHDGKTYWLADGFYRYFAEKHNGALEMEVEVRLGTQDDAILYAATEANRTHGQPLDSGAKSRAILALLKLKKCEGWTATAIAKAIGCTERYVRKVRYDYFNEGETPEWVQAEESEPVRQRASARPTTEDDGIDEMTFPEVEDDEMRQKPIRHIVMDKEDKPVHEADVADAISRGSDILEHVQVLQRCVTAIEQRMGLPHYARVSDRVIKCLRDAIGDLKGAQPWIVCDVCIGSNRDKCRNCNGLGWLSRAQHQMRK